jgi:NAD(P)-dependent dehydrogenase (short-subunit alcohol dehydrogenase family)
MTPTPLTARELFDLTGKKALITGASGFLGRTMARTLLANGAKVIAVGNSARFDMFCNVMTAECNNRDRFAHYRADFGHLDSFREALDRIVEQEGYIEIALNNAHALGARTGFNQREGVLEHASVEHMSANFEGAVLWPLHVAQALGGRMREERSGTIINIASMYAVIAPNPELYEGTPFLNPPGYSAGKAGMLALTRYIASFWGPFGVRCNAIVPGTFPNVETSTENSVDMGSAFVDRLAERTCLKRVGTPSDLAGAVVFLASAASAYITGQALHVDGGWTIT